MRNQVIHFCLVLLFIITFTYARKRFRERKLQDGEGINFPKRVMSRSDAERYIFDKKMYFIYRMSNPKFDAETLKNVEIVWATLPSGDLNATFVASKDGVCGNFEWLFHVVPEEGERAVYTFPGPFPTSGAATTITFFTCNPDNYVFMFHCLDKTKEKVRNGKRVFCDGPYDILFATFTFPPDRVRWCEAEAELRKTFGLTFDNDFWLFNPTGARCQ